MPRQHQIRISREGICYCLVLTAVLAGAVLRQLNLLMLLGSMLVGPLVFSLIYGRLALRRLAIGRKLPHRLRADQKLVVDLTAANRRRWLKIWMIEVEDLVSREAQGQPRAEPLRAGVFFPAIAAGEVKQNLYQGYLGERGRYQFGPLRVSTKFPLGLVRHTLVVENIRELLVHPKLGRLTHDWAKVVHENPSGSQRMQRRGLLEADYYGLRDWRPGDNRRAIHWRTSARRGSLVVRQFEQRRSQDLVLLVDLWRGATATPKEAEHVETAISFVATIIADACRQIGRNLSVHVAGSTSINQAGSASAYFFQEQMDALALVNPHENPRFPAELILALGAISSSIPTLVVSTREIDWESLESAAAELNVRLAGRKLQGINVAGAEIHRYFQE